MQIIELFCNDSIDHFFVINNDKSKSEFKFACHGDIKPSLIKIADSVYAVGINLNFSIFDMAKNAILLSLNLSYFFYEVQIYENYIYVITELEILKIDTNKLICIKTYDLPDIFESISFRGQSLFVKCLDEEVYEFDASY